MRVSVLEWETSNSQIAAFNVVFALGWKCWNVNLVLSYQMKVHFNWIICLFTNKSSYEMKIFPRQLRNPSKQSLAIQSTKNFSSHSNQRARSWWRNNCRAIRRQLAIKISFKFQLWLFSHLSKVNWHCNWNEFNCTRFFPLLIWSCIDSPFTVWK